MYEKPNFPGDKFCGNFSLNGQWNYFMDLFGIMLQTQIHLYPFQDSSLHSFESKANEVKRIERLFLLPSIEKNGSGNNNEKY